MKIGTQNQAFFPENILEKFRYIKEMGFDGFEIDGKLLVNNIEEVKAAIKATIWNWWLSVTAAFPRRRRWQKNTGMHPCGTIRRPCCWR
ncbi:hypothetical protein KIU26_001577 [Escherichia coli]|nr:hypothetical protein [Escherichia coli]